METSRFFVTNLPQETTEEDLRHLFVDYGNIKRIELKTKENPLDSGSINVFAFVTLEISGDDAQYCLKDLNWQKIHGCKVKVSLAKESFLDRLKREREEAENALAQKNEFGVDKPKSDVVVPQNLQNTRKVFDENDDLGGDDIAPELLMTRKRASNSLHNGKIVIENYGLTPLHVIEKTKKPKMHADSKAFSAEQKRKESLKKMNNDYQQKKSVIKQALAGLDAKSSKKIKFSDSDADEEATESAPKPKKDLFSSGDEEEEGHNELNLKPSLYGKKGEKLALMQSRQSLDSRFRIDEKFVDDEDDDDDADGDDNRKDLNTNDNQTEENERDWQMHILEQVVGTKIDTKTEAQKASKNKKMLRFDPSKEEHKKLLRKQGDDEKKEDSQRKRSKAKKDSVDEQQVVSVPQASKEVFYVVSDSLAQSLKSRGDGFSLLNMFNEQRTDEHLDARGLEKERETQLKQLTNERILINKFDKDGMPLKAFRYDSSSDEDDDAGESANKVSQENQPNPNQKKHKKVPILMETFFFTRNDARLKEGAKFFQYEKTETANDEDYEVVRRRLKMLIKTKISKSKKNMLKAGKKLKGRHRKL